MKKFVSFLIALCSLSLMIEDADARRLGGGRNLGMQRSAPAQQQAAPKAPAQQEQAAPAPATPAQQPAGASKWLGPLAGFALGAGLFALFLNNGWAGVLAGVLMIGLIIAAAAFAARALRARLANPPLQYAGAGGGEPGRAAMPGGAGAGLLAAATDRWPGGFDADDFVRHARRNFVRLQEANDRGDLSTLRDVVTPEVYGELEADIQAAGGAAQTTEVVTLNAEVLDVAAERGSYVVSVRFSSLIREAAGREPEAFSEIWHLEKPIDGGSGWLVAGIQQA